LAAGIIDIVYAVGRVPVAESSAGLKALFADTMLPRIAMSESVLGVEISGPGPFTVLATSGIAMGLALVVAGGAVILASGRGRNGAGAGNRWFVPALLALVVFAAMRAVTLWLTATPHPPGAAPFAMVAFFVATLPGVVALLHPGWKSGVLAAAMVAASMQLALN